MRVEKLELRVIFFLANWINQTNEIFRVLRDAGSLVKAEGVILLIVISTKDISSNFP